MRSSIRRLLVGLALSIAVVAAVLGIWTLLPASTPGIKGPDAVASLQTVRIGGIDQWVLMRGRDRSKPVLLYLHGGPGAGSIAFARQYSSRLEEHFVVIHWDQRGAGKSCTPEVPDESLRLERILDDTLELTEWLRLHFGVERIFLLGHSWGSVLGVLAVQRRPELFEAYVGLGQVVDMRLGEAISHRWVVARAKAEGNEPALAQLRTVQPPYERVEDLLVQRSWLGHYGGDMHGGGSFWQMGRSVVTAPEYTFPEKVSYLACFMNSVEMAWGDLLQIDFVRSVPRLEVPVYFFLGRHDFNAPFELVEEWMRALDAPHAEIVWFEHSAHMANIEEPERFQEELIERVLATGKGR